MTSLAILLTPDVVITRHDHNTAIVDQSSSTVLVQHAACDQLLLCNRDSVSKVEEYARELLAAVAFVNGQTLSSADASVEATLANAHQVDAEVAITFGLAEVIRIIKRHAHGLATAAGTLERRALVDEIGRAVLAGALRAMDGKGAGPLTIGDLHRTCRAVVREGDPQ